MDFGKIVAIDWSGARTPGRKIQVAEYRPSDNNVALVSPRQGVNWTRGRVWEQYFDENCNERILVGIDFAFAYPYCDVQAYFPGHADTPHDATSLWAKVDYMCAKESGFYAGPFYLTEEAIFSNYLWYQKYKGCKYEARLRITEDKCKDEGLRPSDAFKCVGPSVGVGSVAGFRFLHKIKKENAAHIWPFCGEPPSSGTILVEIYPARFLKKAGVYLDEGSNIEQVKAALRYYNVCLSSEWTNHDFTDDERDALVSAAGMKWWLDEKGSSAWEAAEQSCTKYEGWIFGI